VECKKPWVNQNILKLFRKFGQLCSPIPLGFLGTHNQKVKEKKPGLKFDELFLQYVEPLNFMSLISKAIHKIGA